MFLFRLTNSFSGIFCCLSRSPFMNEQNDIKCAIPVWITHTTATQLSGDLKLHERWWKIDLGSKVGTKSYMGEF